MFALLLMLCAFSIAQAQQTSTLRGNIVSKKAESIGFATVRLVGTPFGARTDSAGNFRIANIPEGAYTLEAKRIGYKTLKHSIRLEAAQNLAVQLQMDEDTKTTEKLVITGTWRETLISDSPVAVEVFTPSFLKKNPSACLVDALQNVNGLRPQINCGVCGTSDIRLNGLEGAYTMVTLDGMPIVSGLGTVYGLSGIPTSMIERVEVVKGPASTLYGSEALAGIINIITKSPERSSLLALDAFSTSWLEHNLDASLKLKTPIGTGLLGANYYTMSNRVDNNADGMMDAPLQERLSAFLKWNFDRTTESGKRLETSLAARYLHENRLGGQMQWQPEFRGGDSVYGESIWTNRFEALGAYQLPFENENVMLRASFNHHHQNSYYGTSFYEARQQIAFAQLTWDKEITIAQTPHKFLFGAATRYTVYQDNTPATNDANGNATPQRIVLPGVFVQDEFSFAPDHTLLASLRYDWSSAHGSIFTPRLNYKWKSETQDVVRLSGGTGFRVVNLFAEDHAALTGARRVIVREELRPETSYNLNLNYSKTASLDGITLTLDAAAFFTHFTNKIIPDYDTDPEAIIYENLRGFGESKGISASIDADFGAIPLDITLGVTVMDVSNTDDGVRTWQILSERVSGTFGVSYTLEELGVKVDYTGAVYGPMRLPIFPNDSRPEFSPLFSIQNIQFTKTFADTPLEIYCGIKNLLNYTPPANSIMRAFDPFDKFVNDPVNNPNRFTFDPTYSYASFQGIRGFLGVRWRIE
ncbi:MAG: TonB-dependent receptor [Candidatus Kapaibacterium sp.]|nr:MAG: TonB-dependent receptor [Candidatus Kapabacteria bacterium]